MTLPRASCKFSPFSLPPVGFERTHGWSKASRKIKIKGRSGDPLQHRLLPSSPCCFLGSQLSSCFTPFISTMSNREDFKHLQPLVDWMKDLDDPKQLISGLENQVKSSLGRLDELVTDKKEELVGLQSSVETRLASGEIKGDLNKEFKPVKDAFLKDVEAIDHWYSRSVKDMKKKIKRPNAAIWAREKALKQQLEHAMQIAATLFDGYRSLSIWHCQLTKIVSNVSACTVQDIESMKNNLAASLASLQEAIDAADGRHKEQLLDLKKDLTAFSRDAEEQFKECGIELVTPLKEQVKSISSELDNLVNKAKVELVSRESSLPPINFRNPNANKEQHRPERKIDSNFNPEEASFNKRREEIAMPFNRNIEKLGPKLQALHPDSWSQASSVRQDTESLVNIACVRFNAYRNLASMRYRLEGILFQPLKQDIERVEKRYRSSMEEIKGVKMEADRLGMGQIRILLDLEQELKAFASNAQEKLRKLREEREASWGGRGGGATLRGLWEFDFRMIE